MGRFASIRDNPKFINLDGQRYGRLVVLDSALPERKALVKCDCGRQFEVARYSLTRGESTGCGKGLCHAATKNLTGQRFGSLLVVKFLMGKSEHAYGTLWECLCDCGKTHNVVSHSLVTGQTTSCGCQTGLTYSRKTTLPNNQALLNEIRNQYRGHAKKLKLNYLLTQEEFEALIKAPCHYCGVEYSNVRQIKNLTTIEREFRYNGIDRKDSALAYQTDNCVSCCSTCNYAKRKLSYDGFIALTKRISARF